VAGQPAVAPAFGLEDAGDIGERGQAGAGASGAESDEGFIGTDEVGDGFLGDVEFLAVAAPRGPVEGIPV